MDNLYQQWLRDCELCEKALRDAQESAEAAAKAEAEYYAAKHKAAYLMRSDGEPMTMIQESIKGSPEVNEKLQECIRTTELHRVNMKAIDVYREDKRMVYDQMKREQESM